MNAPMRPVPQNTSDLSPTLEGSLPGDAVAALKTIATRASDTGVVLYLVGGSVRDFMLGESIRDLDFAVEGDAPALAADLATWIGGQVVSHAQFGTATLIVGDQRFDLAGTRLESYQRPGALPSVTPGTIHQDLGRRDLSVNAMAIPLSGEEMGRLMDPFGGADDLEAGHIRVLHDGSFVDDATRILRAVRYEQRLGFQIEEHTHGLLLEALEAGMLDTISADRLRRELEHLFQEQRPQPALARCGRLGILQAVHPALGEGPGAGWMEEPVSNGEPLVYLGALAYPMGVQEGESLIRRLNMPSDWAAVVRETILLRRECEEVLERPQATGEPGPELGQICATLDQYSPASIRAVVSLSGSPPVKAALELYLDRLRYVIPALNGTDLISLGVAQGPMVGDILRKLRISRIQGEISSREDEVRMARQYIQTKGG